MTRTPYSYAADMQERAARAYESARDWYDLGDRILAVRCQQSADQLAVTARALCAFERDFPSKEEEGGNT